MKILPAFLLIMASCASALAQPISIPNPSFEKGDAAPAGWTLSGGKGDWLAAGAPDGNRAVAVTGTGSDSNFWRSGPLPMKPGAVYLLRFKARSLGASGGTPVTGPAFCNRDLGKIPDEWADYESVFATPRDLTPEESWIKFGQWQLKGLVAFDAVDLVRAMPVCARDGDLALGEGEIVSGNEYTFEAPFRSASRNHSRPLEGYTCGFNSDRWTLSGGGDVVYRHRIAGRRQTVAEVNVSVTWYAAGELALEVSRDGKAWRGLGVIGKRAAGSYPVPKDLLPADEVWVRFTARPGGEKKTGGASLQVPCRARWRAGHARRQDAFRRRLSERPAVASRNRLARRRPARWRQPRRRPCRQHDARVHRRAADGYGGPQAAARLPFRIASAWREPHRRPLRRPGSRHAYADNQLLRAGVVGQWLSRRGVAPRGRSARDVLRPAAAGLDG